MFLEDVYDQVMMKKIFLENHERSREEYKHSSRERSGSRDDQIYISRKRFRSRGVLKIANSRRLSISIS